MTQADPPRRTDRHEKPVMTTAALPAEQRFVFDNVDWQTYEDMLRTVGDRPSPGVLAAAASRVTGDQ